MLTAVARTRLEKAAVDNGFDRDLGNEGHWLRYGSTQAPLRIWLTALGDGFFVVALSQVNVTSALGDVGVTISNPLPQGAAGARSVLDIPALHHLIRRAFQLSRTLPDELLHAFEAQVAGLPR